MQNWSIVQDARGVMYFATNDGVLEFDGVSWRLLPAPNGSVVRCVGISNEGRVYAGAQNEFGFLAPDSSGRMTYSSLLSFVPSTEHEFGSIRALMTIYGSVFFLSNSHLFRWDVQQEKMRLWRSHTNFKGGFAVANQLYVQQDGTGLMKLQSDSLVEIPFGKAFADQRVYCMLANDSGRNEILIGTRQGLFRHDGDSLRRFPTDADNLLGEYRLQHCAYLPDGSLALATERRGVIIMNRSGHVQQILDKSSGLRDVHVKFIYVDRQGGMWLGLNNSIARYEVSSPSTFFRGTPGMENGVVGLTRHKGTLYASTGLGIYYLLPAKSSDELPEFKPVRGIVAQCGPLLSINGMLFAGTGDGIYQIDGDRSRPVLRGSADRFYVSPHDSTHIYVGFYDGLGLMSVADGRFNYLGRVPGIKEQIRHIAEDRDGALWLGIPNQGLFSVQGISWNVQSQAFEASLRIRRMTSTKELSLNWIFPFRAGDRIVLATSRGLHRFDPSRNLFLVDSLFGESFADSTSAFSDFALDDHGNLWMQHEYRGQSSFGRLVPQASGDYEWESRPLAGGSGFGPVWALWADGDSVIWLGGTDGVLRYDARQSKPKALEFSTLVRRITTKDDSLLFGGYARSNLIPGPSLTYAFNALRFEYAAPSYDAVSENRYQYLLEGFDAAWSSWTKEPKKDYTNLPAGHFSFRVRSKDLYGRIGKEATYTFSILPPFWETWWFRGIVVLLLVLVGPLIYYRRVSQLKKEQRRQQEFSRQLIESQEAERKRIANELHDSLGQNLLVIKNRSALATQVVQDNPKALKQLTEIEATVTDAIKEVRHISQNLHPYQLEAIGLSAAIRSMLTKVSESTEITITGEVEEIDGAVDKHEEINLYRVIQEGLNNILKHSGATKASVIVRKNESTLIISMVDDGKGFAAKPASHQHLSGMGLRDIAERVQLMKGTHTIESSPGKGTKVEVRIPIEASKGLL
ncbi:MAG: hypothetical protein HY961_13875 [Ignavibacteriae bacterium]|nr:hypothetical protein [Ignavibacteriota bacterium]